MHVASAKLVILVQNVVIRLADAFDGIRTKANIVRRANNFGRIDQTMDKTSDHWDLLHLLAEMDSQVLC